MMRMFFGDIVLVQTNQSSEGAIEMPAVVVSADIINENMPGIIICPLLPTKHTFPSRIGATFIPKSLTGFEEDCLLHYFQIRAVPKEFVRKRIGALPHSFMKQVKESLKAVFDIE